MPPVPRVKFVCRKKRKVMGMLFRPSFCANCGEKIERTEWRIWTSRRFCQVCETEFKGQDLIPRAVVFVGVFAGVLGVGGYLKSGPGAETAATVQPKRFAEKQTQTSPPAEPDRGDR